MQRGALPVGAAAVRAAVVKTIEPQELTGKTGYSRPHTSHCGPDAIYMSALGGANGADEAGGILKLDCETFEPLGPWESEDGVVLQKLLAGEYGHSMHVWDLRRGKHVKELDLGPEQQMVLELRPAHDPRREWGFVGVVVSTADLSASVWHWHRDHGDWQIRKAIEIRGGRPGAAAAALAGLRRGAAAR